MNDVMTSSHGVNLNKVISLGNALKVIPPGSVETHQPLTGGREKLAFGLMASDGANPLCTWSRADPNKHVATSSIDGLDVYLTHLASRGQVVEILPLPPSSLLCGSSPDSDPSLVSDFSVFSCFLLSSPFLHLCYRAYLHVRVVFIKL